MIFSYALLTSSLLYEQVCVCVCVCIDIQCLCVCMLSHSIVSDFVIPSTVVCHALPSTGFYSQEYWSGLPFPSPGVLPDPGIEPTSPASPISASRFFTTESSGKPIMFIYVTY